MAKVRTYKGKVVDIEEIMRGHEKDQAVGNANMNAQGDILDERGRVKQTKEDRAREYNKNVSNSVIKSSLLDEVDDLPDIQKATPKKKSTAAKQTTKAAPKKSTVNEDFDDMGDDEAVEDKNDATDGDK